MTERQLALIPLSLRERGVCLRDIGCESWAFPWSVAHQVVEEVARQGWAILGGDVLRQNKGQVTQTHDNWHADRCDGERWDDYVARCRDESLRYLTKLSSADDFERLVDFVLVDQTGFMLLDTPRRPH